EAGGQGVQQARSPTPHFRATGCTHLRYESEGIFVTPAKAGVQPFFNSIEWHVRKLLNHTAGKGSRGHGFPATVPMGRPFWTPGFAGVTDGSVRFVGIP